jgi:hypothetical protein
MLAANYNNDPLYSYNSGRNPPPSLGTVVCTLSSDCQQLADCLLNCHGEVIGNEWIWYSNCSLLRQG